jgi:ABC-type multidrug transport system fused ATPase/permease subunit
MGGLVTSTLLTLLVVPVGFVFLHRLDRLFGRLGPWVMIGWVSATTAVMTPLIVTETISSMTWRIVSTLLVAAALLGVAVLIFRRPQLPRPETDDGPPVVEVRYLHKVYGKPGPVGRAWRVPQRFAEAVKKFGGRAFHPRDALGRLLPITLVLAGALYLALSSRSIPWSMVFLFVATGLVAALLKQLRAARGCADAAGRVDLGGPENVAAALAPWAALVYISLRFRVLAWVTNRQVNEVSESFFEAEAYDVRTWVLIATAIVLLVVQLGRRTAVHIARGRIPLRPRPDSGLLEGLSRWELAVWLAGWPLATAAVSYPLIANETIRALWLQILWVVSVAAALFGIALLFRTRRGRSLWRRFSRFCFGLDLPREEVKALAGVHFRAERGMVGILGPNGAGKTTLLRMLAGILDPSLGTVTIGSVPVKRLRRYLARWVGYLPQDFGLPKDLTAREYVDYYALLYEIRPAEVRRERVDQLLKEVGGSRAGRTGRREDRQLLGRDAATGCRGPDAAAPAAGHRGRRADGRAGPARADPLPQPALAPGRRTRRAVLHARGRGRRGCVRASHRPGAGADRVRRRSSGPRGRRRRQGLGRDAGQGSRGGVAGRGTVGGPGPGGRRRGTQPHPGTGPARGRGGTCGADAPGRLSVARR